jgi:hypothetical protein
MPILSRNHSLFGYLDLPSLSRNTSSSRGYDDPFGPSPRVGGGALGPTARGNSWDPAPARTGVTGGQNLTSVGSNPAYPSLFTGAGGTDLYQYSGWNTYIPISIILVIFVSFYSSLSKVRAVYMFYGYAHIE